MKIWMLNSQNSKRCALEFVMSWLQVEDIWHVGVLPQFSHSIRYTLKYPRSTPDVQSKQGCLTLTNKSPLLDRALTTVKRVSVTGRYLSNLRSISQKPKVCNFYFSRQVFLHGIHFIFGTCTYTHLPQAWLSKPLVQAFEFPLCGYFNVKGLKGENEPKNRKRQT